MVEGRWKEGRADSLPDGEGGGIGVDGGGLSEGGVRVQFESRKIGLREGKDEGLVGEEVEAEVGVLDTEEVDDEGMEVADMIGMAEENGKEALELLEIAERLLKSNLMSEVIGERDLNAVVEELCVGSGP